jgi:Na+/H+-dicarboxylate symporter
VVDRPKNRHDDAVAVAMAVGVVAVLPVLFVAAMVGLTARGAHRRGRGTVVAVVSGLFFPFTWAAWYLVDERPFSR